MNKGTVQKIFCGETSSPRYDTLQALEAVFVYFFESEVCPVIYGLDQPVPVNIYNRELKIDFSSLMQWFEIEAQGE